MKTHSRVGESWTRAGHTAARETKTGARERRRRREVAAGPVVMSLSGKVALVTGGAQGIGRAAVQSLLQSSAQVSVPPLHQQTGLLSSRPSRSTTRTRRFVTSESPDASQSQLGKPLPLPRQGGETSRLCSAAMLPTQPPSPSPSSFLFLPASIK